MVSRADKAARQAALQQLKKIWANKEAQNSKGAKFDGQLAEEQNIPVATGTKRARENDEERKPLPSGKRLKVAGSRVLQDKSTNKLINRPSRQVVDKPKSQVQLEHKGSKQIRSGLPPRREGIIRPQATNQSGLQTKKGTRSQDDCHEKGVSPVKRRTAPRNASWVRDMCRGPPRVSAQAPKPTFKVLEAIAPTPDSAFATAENGSKAFVEGYKKSTAKTIKAIGVIDTGSGLTPKTATDDRVHGLSQSKKRLADTDLESHNHKRTKQNPDPSSNRKQSGGNGEDDGSLMSKVTPEVLRTKRGAEEDLEREQRKRQKTASELGRAGLSAAQVAQDRKVRQRAAGLRNASNTCYYNAVLETLVQTEPVRELCLARADKFASTVGSDVVVGKHTTRQNAQTQAQVADLLANVDPDDVNMSAYMGKLFNSMYFEPQVEGEQAVSPYVCSQAYGRIHPGFDGHQQQDSAQFLTDVLMRLVQEDRAANQLAPNEKSLVESAFEGEECRTLVCTKCRKTSLRDGKFRLLGLNLPRQTSRIQEARTLTDCLDKYVEEVTLAGYKCEHCNQLDQTRSSTRMKSIPQYLAMQVLRMASDETTSWRPRKLMDTVVFPETVDLAPWTTGSEPQVYELYSVIEHIGSSTDSGHYVACVQQKDGLWMHYNDDNAKRFKVMSPVVVLSHLYYSYGPSEGAAKSHVLCHMDLILAGLNAAQRTAVTSPADVLQVLAPPGSGKTKTLTARVAYLLSIGYRPWDILCLTFTIKSAREMRERIAKLIGNGLEAKIILGTFHSVCRRYLVTYGHLIGIEKNFGIADSADSLGIVKRIIKRFKLNIEPTAARTRISRSKAQGTSYTNSHSTPKKNLEQQEFVQVFAEYESALTKANLLDYDDLLLRCVELLRQHPSCVSNVEAVLIDEFQDTNLVQFDLMRLFAVKRKRITIVGDPDQSIYGFRSAEVQNLMRMRKQYPDTLVVLLEENYRSSGAILLSALEVIQQDESRPKKPLLPTHCVGTYPVLRKLPSAAIEAAWIVSEIRRSVHVTGNLLTYSDFAILVRSAALSRHIETAMGKVGIPYRMVGGYRFFDRVEVKVLLDYLRTICQPDNSDALARIINVPSRRIGESTIKALLDEAETEHTTLWTLIRGAVQGHLNLKTKLTPSTEKAIGSLINTILTLRKRLMDPDSRHSPKELLESVIKKLGLREYIEKCHPEDHEARWANVEELIAQAADTVASEDVEADILPEVEGLEQQQRSPSMEALTRFLAHIALSTELKEDDVEEPRPKVTISTIHAAKGLEWPVVFIPAAYEGSIPHSRAEDTDEERRLLYVAMTRAKALLYISCPMKNSQHDRTALSPFLSIKSLASHLDCKGPLFTLDVIQSMSYILHRICPSEADIIQGCKAVPSTEDDFWPSNGEEDPEEDGAAWDSTDGTKAHTTHQQAFKRRRVGLGERAERPSPNQSSTSTSRVTGYSVTMENAETFSVSSTSIHSGFTSAGAHLQDLAQRKPGSGTEIDQDTRSKRRTTDQSSIDKKKSNASFKHDCNRQLNKVNSGQGTLLSFFGQPSNSAYASKEHPARETSPALLMGSRPPETLPNLRDGARPISKSREPMLPIPQPLSEHRLKSTPIPTRPPKIAQGLDHKTTQYPFFSSSPPPIESLIEEAEASKEKALYDNRSHNQNLKHTVSQISDARPATTFHTTSAAQVRSVQATNRTLGVRRSMNGWTNRGGHNFSVPGRINDR